MKLILIVEDELDVMQTIRMVLESSKYTVLEAYDGVSALDVLETNKVDLMISDIRMPRLDGLELLDNQYGLDNLELSDESGNVQTTTDMIQPITDPEIDCIDGCDPDTIPVEPQAKKDINLQMVWLCCTFHLWVQN